MTRAPKKVRHEWTRTVRGNFWCPECEQFHSLTNCYAVCPAKDRRKGKADRRKSAYHRAASRPMEQAFEAQTTRWNKAIERAEAAEQRNRELERELKEKPRG